MMGAYYDAYTNPELVDEYLLDVSVRISIPICRELLSQSGGEPQTHDRDGNFLCRYPKTGAAKWWAGISTLFGYPQTDTLPEQ